MSDKPNIFAEAEDNDAAYGIVISISDTELFDNLARCKARKIVDVAVEYNGVTKEYLLSEFLTLHGFMGEAADE